MACLGDWGSGGTPKKGNPQFYDGDIPWLKIGDLNDDLVLRAETRITSLGLENSSARMVPEGAVFLAMYGSIGKSGIAGIECCTNQAIANCIPDARVLASSFLFRLILALRADLLGQGKGGAQQNISQTVIKHLEVAVPPLAEQHRIVARVDELMALLDRLEAAKEARDATRAQLRDAALAALQDANDAKEVKTAWSRIADHMHDLFTDPADIPPLRQAVHQLATRGRLVQQIPSEGGASQLLAQIEKQKADLIRSKSIRPPKALSGALEEKEPCRLPDQWKWCRLGALSLTLAYGSSQKSSASGRVPVLRMGNLQKGCVDWSNLKYSSDDDEIEKYSLQPGSVLFNRTNSPALVGKTAIYRGERPAIFAGYLIHVNLADGVEPEYINQFLNSPLARDWCWNIKTDGVSQSNISASKLAMLHVPLPPAKEQKRIIVRLNELDSLMERLEASLRTAREVRASKRVTRTREEATCPENVPAPRCVKGGLRGQDNCSPHAATFWRSLSHRTGWTCLQLHA